MLEFRSELGQLSIFGGKKDKEERSVTPAIPFLPTQQIRSRCRSVASGPSDYGQNTNSWLCYRSSCTIKDTMSEFLDTVSYSFAHVLQQLSYMQCLRNSLAMAKASSYKLQCR